MNEQLKRVLSAAARLLRIFQESKTEPSAAQREAAQLVAEEIEELIQSDQAEAD